MFYLLKIGPNFRRSVQVKTFVRIQKVIWDHLLASKKEASFSFPCALFCCLLCFFLSRVHGMPKNVCVGGYS